MGWWRGWWRGSTRNQRCPWPPQCCQRKWLFKSWVKSPPVRPRKSPLCLCRHLLGRDRQHRTLSLRMNRGWTTCILQIRALRTIRTISLDRHHQITTTTRLKEDRMPKIIIGTYHIGWTTCYTVIQTSTRSSILLTRGVLHTRSAHRTQTAHRTLLTIHVTGSHLIQITMAICHLLITGIDRITVATFHLLITGIGQITVATLHLLIMAISTWSRERLAFGCRSRCL